MNTPTLVLALSLSMSAVAEEQDPVVAPPPVEAEGPSPNDVPVQLARPAPASGQLIGRLRGQLLAARAEYVQSLRPRLGGTYAMFFGSGLAGLAGAAFLLGIQLAPATFQGFPFAIPILFLVLHGVLGIGAPLLLALQLNRQARFDQEGTPLDAEVARLDGAEADRPDSESAQRRLDELEKVELLARRARLMAELPSESKVSGLFGSGLALTAASAILWIILGSSGALRAIGGGSVIGSALVAVPLVLATALGVTGVTLLVVSGGTRGRREERLTELRELEEHLPLAERRATPEGR